MKKRLMLFTVLLVAAMLMAACGDDDGEDDANGGDEGDQAADAPAETPTPEVVEIIEVDPVEVDVTAEEAGTYTISFSGFAEALIEDFDRVRRPDNENEFDLDLFNPFVGSQGSGVELYFPFDLEAGSYAMIPYSTNYSAGRITARVQYAGEYYNTSDGTLTIEEITEDNISGRFALTAIGPTNPDRVFDIEGIFNAIPLQNPE